MNDAARRELATVLIPVRNEAEFIDDCLDSLCKAAGMADLEIIIIDDHSDDMTAQIVDDYAKVHPELDLRLIHNPGKGKAAALNHGFAAARGSVFLLLAGDDILEAAMVPMRITGPTGHAGPVVATCRYRTFSEQPEFDGIMLPRPGHVHQVAGGAASFNRAFADLYFPIPEILPNEDSWMRAIIMLFDVPHLRLDGIGLHYRIHAGNSGGMTHDFATNSAAIARRAQAYELAMSRPDAPPAGQARLAPMVRAEKLRRAGRWYALPFIHGLSTGDKMVAIANAAPWAYALKARLSRLLSGRISSA